ncbi:hypothetical protein GCK72_010157 [Caenorhabditis remanei]|uniref:Uncharacterized protein n=1 Tax=Caenorhabditis remanei TaxID=31234 RepID=A0A6A5H2I0_CAERE|nr:hypothetical protein GCK72_010157 [Caenorhabditis remanei]KAF1761898.1 hypothetical protein GCK72_010157 [Caenorhabditis remanei]
MASTENISNDMAAPFEVLVDVAYRNPFSKYQQISQFPQQKTGPNPSEESIFHGEVRDARDAGPSFLIRGAVGSYLLEEKNRTLSNFLEAKIAKYTTTDLMLCLITCPDGIQTGQSERRIDINDTLILSTANTTIGKLTEDLMNYFQINRKYMTLELRNSRRKPESNQLHANLRSVSHHAHNINQKWLKFEMILKPSEKITLDIEKFDNQMIEERRKQQENNLRLLIRTNRVINGCTPHEVHIPRGDSSNLKRLAIDRVDEMEIEKKRSSQPHEVVDDDMPALEKEGPSEDIGSDSNGSEQSSSSESVPSLHETVRMDHNPTQKRTRLVPNSTVSYAPLPLQSQQNDAMTIKHISGMVLHKLEEQRKMDRNQLFEYIRKGETDRVEEKRIEDASPEELEMRLQIVISEFIQTDIEKKLNSAKRGLNEIQVVLRTRANFNTQEVEQIHERNQFFERERTTNTEMLCAAQFHTDGLKNAWNRKKNSLVAVKHQQHQRPNFEIPSRSYPIVFPNGQPAQSIMDNLVPIGSYPVMSIPKLMKTVNGMTSDQYKSQAHRPQIQENKLVTVPTPSHPSQQVR